mmetsp:Transcript_43226/g.82505  ORF Transcript_43226/g.82505 Transcript_43226/m.82505 type:complete len:140 (+) Transcript_43226:274-693(+)
MGVLHEVARRGDPSAVDYLKRELVAGKQLEAIDEVDLDMWTPLHFACLKGKEQAALMLLKRGANPNAQTRLGRTPLQFACMKKLSNAVRLLLDKNADPHHRDAKGLKALDVCPDGDCKIMLYDYEEGGNPNAPTEDHDL